MRPPILHAEREGLLLRLVRAACVGLTKGLRAGAATRARLCTHAAAKRGRARTAAPCHGSFPETSVVRASRGGDGTNGPQTRMPSRHGTAIGHHAVCNGLLVATSCLLVATSCPGRTRARARAPHESQWHTQATRAADGPTHEFLCTGAACLALARGVNGHARGRPAKGAWRPPEVGVTQAPACRPERTPRDLRLAVGGSDELPGATRLF